MGKESWEYDNMAECYEAYTNFVPFSEGPYCNATWDRILCWPPTPAGSQVFQPCPPVKGVDISRFAFKRCSVDGLWEGRKQGDYSVPQGWTNYTDCFTPEIRKLLNKLYSRSVEEAHVKFRVAQGTRIIEIVGLTVSLLSVLTSLAIFCYFRSLRNTRTRIHQQLFIAIIIKVLVRLALYTDQAIVRGDSSGLIGANFYDRKGIDNTPILCEGAYVLLEYARTAMFMWMFIEGLYLNNMVAIAFYRGTFHRTVFCSIGWGIPAIMTSLWVFAMIKYYGNTKCWWGYSFTIYFWILEGPRCTVIIVNLLFLLNIIRVLVTKLRESNSSETQQLRKSVKAAIVLLPLLGITNIVNMVPSPLDRSASEFALWSYTSNFFRSFQGFFIALLYCFLNAEVRVAGVKQWRKFRYCRSITEVLPPRNQQARRRNVNVTVRSTVDLRHANGCGSHGRSNQHPVITPL